MIGSSRRPHAALLLVLVILGLVATPAAGQTTATGPFDPAAFAFDLELVVDGLSAPVALAGAPDGRLFLVEETGTIRVWQDGALLPEPLLDISSEITTQPEQGLLGIALHPDFATNGVFFIDYTDLAEDTHISRRQVSAADPNREDPALAVDLLVIDQPYSNHNGGSLAFGPDGLLYIGMGDGGAQGDPHGNGQDPHALLGSILRIDVNSTTGNLPYGIPVDNPWADGVDGAPEVFIKGLRNPWRFSFDRETGDLWIGDVGQDEWEEVDLVPAGTGAGVNLGWNLVEGTHPYAGEPTDALTPPVWEYHHEEGCSVVGGYVARGPGMGALSGVYLFADYCSGRVWGLGRDASGAWVASAGTRAGFNVSSFGEDAAGNLYLIGLEGVVYRMLPGPGS